MNTKLLIDAIVRQTTVLIAQIATAAGIRAPLAHIADRVFVELAQEIERQGVGRKIAADMFGMALRTYQTRTQRLSESATLAGKTLWEAVYAFVVASSAARRQQVFERFRNDPKEDVGAVLNDLVQSGLVSATGRGDSLVYRAVTPAEQSAVLEADPDAVLADLAWLALHRTRGQRFSELCASLPAPPEQVQRAVDRLIAQGIVRKEDNEADPLLSAESFVIPVAASRGWEAAVFDHFSTVAAAIAAKIGRRAASHASDLIGGATFTFDVYPGHPFEEAVAHLLARTRAQVDALWEEVAGYNAAHPVPDERKNKVSFYFGQNVERPEELEREGKGEAR